MVKQFLRNVFGEATEAPAAAPAPASSSTIVQYDTAGSAIDVPKMILLDQGFKIGNTYHAKGPLASDPSQSMVWKLISIAGDGSSELQAYSGIGSLVEKYQTVTGEELSGSFARFEKSSRCAASILRMRQITMIK